MSEQSMSSLIDRMIMSSGRDAERARWRLEAAYLPNQVLKPGAEKLVQDLFSRLDTATPDGAVESWEVLSQAAAGVAGPTAASGDTVRDVRSALVRHLRTALDRLWAAEPQPYDYLAADVVDALLGYVDPEVTATCLAALAAFGSRGETEARQVAVILGD